MKTMRKRAISLFLALILCMGMVVPAMAAEAPYTATLTGDGISVTIHNVVRESVLNIQDINGVSVGEKTVYWVPSSGADLTVEIDESVYPGSAHWKDIGLSDVNVYGIFDFAHNLLPDGELEARWESQSMRYASIDDLSNYALDISKHSITKENEDGEFVSETEIADGSWFISRFIGQSLSEPHAIICFGFVNETIQTPTQPIAEVPSSWAAAYVTEATAAGLVPDTLQSKFTQATTRAEFCALAVALYETAMGQEILKTSISFLDTTDENVLKMASISVVNGVGDDRFDPDAKLTREQAAAMLSRLANAMGKPLTAGTATFADTGSLSSWAVEPVGQMQATGVMTGVGENTFAPKSDYTREQSIITILRLYNLVK